MCIDSAARPEDMHLPITLWPCHSQGGNQVFFAKATKTKQTEKKSFLMDILWWFYLKYFEGI
jgi:hypothetical protein